MKGLCHQCYESGVTLILREGLPICEGCSLK
jgi:hypothetical protein